MTADQIKIDALASCYFSIRDPELGFAPMDDLAAESYVRRMAAKGSGYDSRQIKAGLSRGRRLYHKFLGSPTKRLDAPALAALRASGLLVQHNDGLLQHNDEALAEIVRAWLGETT